MRSIVPSSGQLARFLSLVPLLVIIAALFSGCDRSREVVHDLTEREANQILVFLGDRNIPAQKVMQLAAGAGGQGPTLYMVTVHVSLYQLALKELTEAGLPRPASRGKLDVFGEGGLVATEREEQIKYQATVEQELAAAIRGVDGVLDARIALSVPEEDPLNPDAEKKPKTASVYIKHQGVLDDPNSHLITKIKDYVSGAVDGLEFKNVTIFADRARFGGSSDLQGLRDEEKQFVVIWSMTVGKDSVSRFQLIFAGLIIGILVLSILLIVVLWKFLPVLSAAGGFGRLLSFSAITPDMLTHRGALAKKRSKKGGEEEEESTLKDIDEEEGMTEEGEEET